MDELHRGGIEIVSPNFMNQRVLDPAREFIPKAVQAAPAEAPAVAPEAVVFDKADEAESLEQLRSKLAELAEEASDLKHQLKTAPDDAARKELERRLERIAARTAGLERTIAAREEAAAD
jgi:hypothetical protein